MTLSPLEIGSILGVELGLFVQTLIQKQLE